MTATRTDIHRPSAPDFDPAGYELVDVFDLGDTEPNGDNAELARVEESMFNRGCGWTSPYFDAARCGHCGAHLRYAALMHHMPTNTMMFVGSTCLSERFAEMTADKFADLRSAAAAKAEITREMNRRHELAAAGLKFLASAPALLVELSYAGNGGVVDGNSFLSDIARKVFQYGDLSERQVAAAERAILQGIERATEREAELVEHPAVDAPEGRVTVTGEVVMTKWYDNDFDSTLKMIVRDDSGFRVFVSVPSSLMGVGIDKGSRVTLVATLTQSDDDPTFSFGKRPTKASLLA